MDVPLILRRPAPPAPPALAGQVVRRRPRNQGCNGGLMDNAFTWIESNCTVAGAAYQYTPGSGTTGTCKKTAAAAKVSGYSDVPQGSESGVKSSIAQEPTSVATKADKSVFQLCKPGVGDFDSTQIFDSAHDLHPNICLQTYLLPNTIYLRYHAALRRI